MLIICALLNLAFLLLLLRAVLSWFPLAPGGFGARFYGVVLKITEPVLAPLRGLLPPVQLGGMALDLTIMVPFLAIIVLRGVLC